MRQRGLDGTVVAALIVGMVLTNVLAGCQQQSATVEPTEAVVTGGAGFSVPEPFPQDWEWVSLEEAERRVDFRILLPTRLSEGDTVTRVRLLRTDTPRHHRPAVWLFYSSGLITRQNWAAAPPEAAYFEWLKQPRTPTPVPPGFNYKLLNPDAPPWLVVEVNGAYGIGHEGYGPVRKTFSYEMVRYPASVVWWVDGMGYSVQGDMPLEELLRVAESMR